MLQLPSIKDSVIYYNDDILARAQLPLTRIDNLEDIPINDIKSIEYSEDGPVLRLYFNKINNKWYVATTNKIDANETRFSGNKFGESFWEIFDSGVLDTLDQGRTYFFILKHPKNRNVILYERKGLTFLYSISNKEQTVLYTNIFSMANIKSPVSVKWDGTLKGLQKIYNRKQIKMRGLIIKTHSNNFIIDYPSFSEIEALINNQCDIRFAYIQQLVSGNLNGLIKMYKVFPEHRRKFYHIREQLYNICKNKYEKSKKTNSLEEFSSVFYKKTSRSLYKLYVGGMRELYAPPILL
jgi:hypothetical protein